MHGVKRANYDTLQTKSVSVEELQEIESYKLLIKEFNELVNLLILLKHIMIELVF